MNKNKEYVKMAMYNVLLFSMLYIQLVIKAYNIIDDFNYIGGFLMVMGVALLFTTVEVLARIEYKKKMERVSKEKWSWQSVAKMKTIFYSLVPISLVLLGFIYAQIIRFLGWEDLPSNKVLLIAAVCTLLVSVPAVAICNYLLLRRKVAK